MDLPKVINLMNDILRHEWTGVAQYSQAGFVVQGIWREVYASKFFDMRQRVIRSREANRRKNCRPWRSSCRRTKSCQAVQRRATTA